MISRLIQKLYFNIAFDIRLFTRRPVSLFECVRYTFRKYFAIVSGAQAIKFMGKNFAYDNKFTPVFLPNHIYEIQDLAEYIDFQNVKEVLDIGANIGLFTFGLKSLYPNVKVYSFEPNAAIFPILQKNAAQFSNWKCHNYGVGQISRKLPFFFIAGKSAQGSIHRENAIHDLAADQVTESHIEIREFNSALKTEIGFSEPIDLIKIDVEGAEEEVLKAISILKWKYLYVELSDAQAGGLLPEAVMKILNAHSSGEIKTLMKTEPAGSASIYSLLLEKK